MIYSMDMNIRKTKQYYRRLTDEDICDCSYCQNYVREIRATYGDVAAYLDKMGSQLPGTEVPGLKEHLKQVHFNLPEYSRLVI